MLGSTYIVDGRADGRKTGRLYRTLLKQVRQKSRLLETYKGPVVIKLGR